VIVGQVVAKMRTLPAWGKKESGLNSPLSSGAGGSFTLPSDGRERGTGGKCRKVTVAER